MTPQWLLNIEIQETEETRRLLSQEIAELEAQTLISVARQQTIRGNTAVPRNRSRRATSNQEGCTQALIEIDSYIATIELKLTQKRRKLSAAIQRLHYLSDTTPTTTEKKHSL